MTANRCPGHGAGWWPAAALLVMALGLLLAWPGGRAAAQPRPGLSGPPVAEAVLVRGVLKLRRDGVEEFYRRAGHPIPLLETDVIQTGENTRARVTLLDTGESVEMYANSHLALATIRDDLTAIDLNVGKALFAFIRGVLGGRDVTVSTETMVVGVKGTEFIVGAEGDQSFVLTLDGTVSATSRAEPEREVEVQPDEVYYVTRTVVPESAEAVDADTRERIRTEEGLQAFREQAGLAEPEAEGAAELGIWSHIGLASHNISIPFKIDGRDFEREVDSAGVLLTFEWQFLGWLSIGAFGFEGEVVDSKTASSDPLDATDDEGGRTTMAGALLGLRTAGDSWSWGLHGGWQNSETRLPSGELGLGERSLSMRGPVLRGLVDYVTEGGITLGAALYYAEADATGSEVDRMEAAGADVDTADLVLLSLNLGVTF